LQEDICNLPTQNQNSARGDASGTEVLASYATNIIMSIMMFTYISITYYLNWISVEVSLSYSNTVRSFLMLAEK
jgi:hypothetical protein